MEPEIKHSFGILKKQGDSRCAEEALKEAVSHLQLIFQNMINAFVVFESVFDDQNRYVSFRFGYFNEAYSKIAKLELDDVLGRDVFEVWPGTEKSWLDVYRDVALTGRPKTFDMYHEPTKGLYHCNAYRPGDAPDYVCVIFEDITERDRDAKTLRESEEKYRALIETTDTGYAICDADGNVLDGNAEYVRLTGHKDLDEIRGKNILEWTAWHDIKKNSLGFASCVEKGFIRDLNIDYIDGEGRATPIEINATLIETSSGPEILTLCRDITERKKAEEEKEKLRAQLNQANKMEAIGTLAGGIAHDFNNLLTSLMGYTSLIQLKMDKNNPLQQYVQQVLSASQKAADLIRSLLAFSRQQLVTLNPLDMNKTISTTKQLLKRLLTEDIELRTSLKRGDAVVMADRSQMDQILFNLATNARDAMPKGGLLFIETDIVSIDEGFREAHGFGKKGRYVLITVSDTGEGMDQTTLEKIFDPFFTTKEIGKGTGLGLATVYGIVKQHNGYITVCSEPGRGTIFRIYLPAIGAKAVDEKDRAATSVITGNETILVAEDDEDVRHFMMETLKQHGYKTVEAVDGEDAVEKFKKHKGIDLIIADSVMPKKNGREVYEEIHNINPSTRVLFISGYTKDIVLDRGIGDGEFDFVAKPLSLDTLLHKVREVLDR